MSNKQQKHICQWCGVNTTQSDDECYANPNNSMSNKKQTAFCQYVNDTLKGEAKEISYYLELEKQQHSKTYGIALKDMINNKINFEKYYKETYE